MLLAYDRRHRHEEQLGARANVTDDELRAAERRARERPDDAAAVEAYDRELVRAGLPTQRQALIERLLVALIQRSTDQLLRVIAHAQDEIYRLTRRPMQPAILMHPAIAEIVAPALFEPAPMPEAHRRAREKTRANVRRPPPRRLK